MGAINYSELSVLVVDDEKFSLKIVSQIVKAIGFKRVMEAKDGDHALAVLEGAYPEPVDLVIADFNMPVKTGLEMLQQIRVGYKVIARDLPVAILTGNTDTHLVAAAIGLDVDAFIAKPVSRVVLEKKLNRVLQHKVDLKTPAIYRDINMDIAIANRAEAKVEIEHKGPSVLEEKKTGREVLLSRVQNDAILTRPIKLSNGKVILKAGTRLNDKLLDKVLDLNSLGEKIETVWVE